eukprot:scaffold1147_cov126-Cylindrotheca_fusiformis.AAC.8
MNQCIHWNFPALFIHFASIVALPVSVWMGTFIRYNKWRRLLGAATSDRSCSNNVVSGPPGMPRRFESTAFGHRSNWIYQHEADIKNQWRIFALKVSNVCVYEYSSSSVPLQSPGFRCIFVQLQMGPNSLAILTSKRYLHGYRAIG